MSDGVNQFPVEMSEAKTQNVSFPHFERKIRQISKIISSSHPSVDLCHPSRPRWLSSKPPQPPQQHRIHRSRGRCQVQARGAGVRPFPAPGSSPTTSGAPHLGLLGAPGAAIKLEPRDMTRKKPKTIGFFSALLGLKPMGIWTTPCQCADSLVSGTIPSLLDALYFTSCCSCSSAYPIDREKLPNPMSFCQNIPCFKSHNPMFIHFLHTSSPKSSMSFALQTTRTLLQLQPQL